MAKYIAKKVKNVSRTWYLDESDYIAASSGYTIDENKKFKLDYPQYQFCENISGLYVLVDEQNYCIDDTYDNSKTPTYGTSSKYMVRVSRAYDYYSHDVYGVTESGITIDGILYEVGLASNTYMKGKELITSIKIGGGY